MTKFDKDYMNYWQGAVEKSIDGTVVPGPAVCNHYVQKLNLKRSDKVLDLGCSFGRMQPVLGHYADHTFGVEVDADVVKVAAEKGYEQVLQGQAEKIPYADQFFDAVMSWAVFDVVDQVVAFQEVNRVLKTGGQVLITGKNAHYLPEDRLGFVAERNAHLKGFPNRFTNLQLLLKNISQFGFQCEETYLFSQRGDLGLNQVRTENDGRGYEYAFILKKIGPCQLSRDFDWSGLTVPISLTAQSMAKQANFTDVKKFFQDSMERENR